MGLDMYLNKSTPTKPWDDVKWDDFGRSDQTYLKSTVGYWRKANAVHKFFVDKTQGGNDDCRESYVPREVLENLVEICEKICKAEGIDAESFDLEHFPHDLIEKPLSKDGAKLAKELLPPCRGFLFGTYELDGSYLYDLIKTVQMVKPLFEDEAADFSYEASW